jgi:2-phospho-L-lactate/phosphoenolpyruvate guanylyltransferase
MPTLAILPIKNFAEAKQRLASELTPGPRKALVEAMFYDVLVALRRSAEIDDTMVVTDDRTAQRIAGGHGAIVLDDSDRGHSAAAAAGARGAMEQGFDRVLLIPGDCPLVSPTELDELLLRRAGSRSALIIPDRHGTGTNALLLRPPDSMMPSFGPDSRERHVASAQAAEIDYEVVEVPSLALDVDTPEDLVELQATLATLHGRAAHTRGMLSQLMRSRA